MPDIKFYDVDNKFIDYLIHFDSEVRQHKNSTRPYLFIQLTINNKDYLIPLSSPKFNKIRNKALIEEIIDLKQNVPIGYLEYHKMIPFNDNCCTEIIINNMPIGKYKDLLSKEYTYIQSNIKLNNIIRKADVIYRARYDKNNLLYQNYLSKYACDFDLLEKLNNKYADFLNGDPVVAYRDDNDVWVVEIEKEEIKDNDKNKGDDDGPTL